MIEILELAKIKIDIKMRANHLAVVTLNWQDIFEVRYCRLTLRGDGSVWFQPPALKDFGWAKCFAVMDHSNWIELEKKVVEQFMKELKERVEQGDFGSDCLNKIKGYQEREDIDPNDIPF